MAKPKPWLLARRHEALLPSTLRAMAEEHNDTLTHAPGAARARDERLYVLVLEEESSSIFHLPLDGRVVVGREPGVELHIRDRAASRQHAQLVAKKGEVEVVDLGSHNGTLVNGERISAPRALVSGDVVTIGEVGLVFHSGGASNRTRIVDLATLRRRLAEEIQRAEHFGRALCVCALHFREPPENPHELAVRVAGLTRTVDFMAWLDGAQLLLVLPEVAPGSAAFADLPAHRAGWAAYPNDGLDVDALVGAAGLATGEGADGRVPPASTIVLGERAILLADPAMLRLFDLVRRLARSDLPVLISGETGVGKESAAYAVHHWSKRSAGKFLPINCAALPDNLFESEFFGYEKGAFSGAAGAKPGLLELASGGTVFLDEVGELSAPAQAKLLRVLETKTLMRLGGVREIDIDVRVVAATNRQLDGEVDAGRFRRDLFFRLSGGNVVLPPLRDRPRELALLLRALLTDACARLERTVPAISGAALAALARYRWPGNIRELKNAMEFVAAAAGPVVQIGDLPERITEPPPRAPLAPATISEPTRPLPLTTGSPKFRALSDEIHELERTRLTEALAAAAGVKAKAARLIDMPLRTFVAKLKQYEIDLGHDDE